MLKVTGRVSIQESGEGIPGLHVKAVDKDLIFDDVLGTAVTDANGDYEITYERRDFAELFEKAPDLYIIVRDPSNKRILSSSEDQVRCNVGAHAQVNISIPQVVLTTEMHGPRPPYGPHK